MHVHLFAKYLIQIGNTKWALEAKNDYFRKLIIDLQENSMYRPKTHYLRKAKTTSSEVIRGEVNFQIWITMTADQWNEYFYAALNNFKISKELKSQQGYIAKDEKNVTSFQ